MRAMTSERISIRGFAHGLLAIAIAAISFPAQPAAAQQLTGFPQAELPRYTVELIIFTYAEDAVTSDEIFVPESPSFDEFMTTDAAGRPDGEVPVFSDRPETSTTPLPGEQAAPGSLDQAPAPAAASPAQPGAAAAATGIAGGEAANEISGIEHNLHDLPLRTHIELELLGPEQYSMDEIYRKLVELDAYRPILRTAWTQATPGPDEAPAIRLRALGNPPPGLDGTVKLYQGRFVHLGVDLELDAEGINAYGAGDRRSATDQAIAGSVTGNQDTLPDGGTSHTPVPVYSDTGYSEEIYFGDGSFRPQPVRYRIDEVRIMRDGDLRYYDHPRFGVIAKLTAIPRQERAPANR